MEFYRSISVILVFILVLLLHVLSALLDSKIPTPVFKISYINILLHMVLIALMLYESIALSELSVLFMASLLVYILSGYLESLRKPSQKNEEGKDDI